MSAIRESIESTIKKSKIKKKENVGLHDAQKYLLTANLKEIIL